MGGRISPALTCNYRLPKCCLFDLLAKGGFVLLLLLSINLTTGVQVKTFSFCFISPVLIPFLSHIFPSSYFLSPLCVNVHLVPSLWTCSFFQSPDATGNHRVDHLLFSLSHFNLSYFCDLAECGLNCSDWMLTYVKSEIRHSHTQFPLLKMANTVCVTSQLYTIWEIQIRESLLNSSCLRRWVHQWFSSFKNGRAKGWLKCLKLTSETVIKCLFILEMKKREWAVHVKPHRYRHRLFFLYPVSCIVWDA